MDAAARDETDARRALGVPGGFVASPRRFLLGVGLLALATFLTSELIQRVWIGWDPDLANRFPLEMAWHVVQAALLLALTGSMRAALLLALLVQGIGYAKLVIIHGTVSVQDLRQVGELWLILTVVDKLVAVGIIVSLAGVIAWLSRGGLRATRLAVIAAIAAGSTWAWMAPGPALALIRPAYHQPSAWHRHKEVVENGLLSAFVYQSLRMKSSLEELLADAEILTQFPPYDFRSLGTEAARAAAPDRPPNIHMLMLESFVHPDYLRTPAGAPLTYSQPVLVGSFADVAAKSQAFTLSPTYGGGTAMAEFELVCGVPSVRSRFEPIAFNLLGGHPARCLPWYLGELGYRTVASAANPHTYFNSERAYASAGFDELYFKRDFDMSDRDGVWLSTGSSLRQSLAFAGDLASRPVFNYHATVAAHVPYDRDEARRPDAIDIAEPVHESVHKITQHSHYTSIAVSAWLDELRERDPDAIVVIVADHLPPLSSDEEWDHLFGPKMTPHATDGHRTLHNKWTTWAAVVHRGEVLPLQGLSMFQLPSIVVDVLTGGALCAEQRCLTDRPYLLRRPIFRRDPPSLAACKTEREDEPAWCPQAKSELREAVKMFRSVVRESNTPAVSR